MGVTSRNYSGTHKRRRSQLLMKGLSVVKRRRDLIGDGRNVKNETETNDHLEKAGKLGEKRQKINYEFLKEAKRILTNNITEVMRPFYQKSRFTHMRLVMQFSSRWTHKRNDHIG